MNKIYAVKRNAKGEMVVVSEISKGISKRIASRLPKYFLFSSIIPFFYSFSLCASDVGNILPYQTYLDFAQNKGVFQAGTQSITLYDKSGNATGVLDEAPMIDFSSVDKIGVATLVNPQYVVSVKHNGGYQSVRYGNYTYKIVDRNNHSSLDFHAPRLNKIVTEVIPAEMTQAGTVSGIYANKTRFPVFYRIGSGTQYIKTPSGQLQYISAAYSYLTGGTVGSLGSYQRGEMITTSSGQLYNSANGPMATYGEAGDSGSPLFGFDTTINKWSLVGVLTAGNGAGGNGNNWAVIPVDYVKGVLAQDSDPAVNNTSSEKILWTFDNQTGNGNLTQGDQGWDMHGSINGENINNGKNLTFLGSDGQIMLNNSVDQGAGALIFDANYTVSADADKTWKGGGIIVNSARNVDWQVNGVQGDNLHKLGTGTLKINGTGINPGGLNVGEGTVILAQNPDSDGNVQAFSIVNIVSGRPTVVLSDDLQVNPDNIMWDYRGGKLDINGNSLTFHQLKGADYGAVLTNSGKHSTVNLDFNKSDTTTAVSNIWHGHFSGNIDINNVVTSGAQNDFIMDGGMNTQGSFNQQNGHLFIQGHPVIHATSSQALANKLNELSDNSVLTQPVSFTQSDWETRHFSLKQLNLYNADFSLARNAILNTDINADNSIVTLGSEDLYIDLNDGNGVKTTPSFGQSKATNDADQSHFTGHVQLNNGSILNINEYFTGGIDSTDSTVNILSKNTTLNHPGYFSRSSLNIGDNATLTSTAGFYSDGDVVLGSSSTLSLLSSKDSLLWSSYSAHSWHLNGKDPKLSFGDRTTVYGDIISDYNADIHFGPEYNTSFTDSLRAAYDGNMSAPVSSVSMQNTFWQLRNNSSIHKLKLDNAQLNFEQHEGFSALDVGKLDISNSQVFMTSDGYSSDKLNVKQSLTGGNNTLIVVPSTTATGKSGSPVSLISAPGGTSTELFSLKTATLNIGFSLITPDVSTVSTEDATQWVLNGFHVQNDTKAVNSGRSFMRVAYKSYLTEVNNMNKRMGDLRDINGEAGAWARIMSGTGSASGGFSDNYTHVQVGVDKKHELDGLDLFTGFTVTHTDSSASADVFSGKTKSVGAGLYASAMFDSGAYIDLIGKYVHHDNEYTATFAGLGTRDYSTHSWYAGAEAGYRYHVTEDAWIEPQAELVYGSVSGKQFAWKDQGMHLSMKDKDYNPLIGRTGVDVGKSFSGKDWKVTARAGLGYQFDLLANGETVLRDASGEKRIKGEKDSRMLMSVGLNAEIRDNIRFGLEFEKSAFGKYNVDNAVNANFRYSF
ncbi:autotransporter outer membrane beta-barrel domain-containing protein [Escherichia coli]